MLATRVIPCLDVTAGRVVKGTNFVDLRDAGDPIEIARRYQTQGADEICFLDITASPDKRGMLLDMISRCAEQVFVPLTVGGGVRDVDDVRKLLRAGADKVSINSAAVANPDLIARASDRVGAQSLVVAIDAKRVAPDQWHVYVMGGRQDTGIDVLEWAQTVEKKGCGEILLTSMDRDGTLDGFDLTLTKRVAQAVNIPVIASGGVGQLSHLADGVRLGHANAVLAASIFHFGEYTIYEAKKYLQQAGLSVRIPEYLLGQDDRPIVLK